MKRSTMLTTALGCATVILTATASFAQAPVHRHHRISTANKDASDQAMQAGLSSLQAASGALQGGNTGQAISDIESAIASMKSARRIYEGHRDRSIHAAGHAIVILQRNRRGAIGRASTALGRAISDAQQALQTN